MSGSISKGNSRVNGPGPVVGRLAPSPTGGLHPGHARTFLIAWLAAKSRKGRVLLRLDDIDAERLKPGAIESAADDLRWLGLEWDGEPIFQSNRSTEYDRALTRLRELEFVYPCTCTRSDIARASSAPHRGDQGPSYPGTCAGRSADEIPAGRAYAWRFRVPAGSISWNDLIKGPLTMDLGDLGGDFIVGRSTGEPAYQLATVVDDQATGVTQVVRGDDLIASTPRQILIQRALRFSTPEYGHAPLVVDEAGRRLAKRDGAIKLSALREKGMDPRVLIGLLAQSCGWSDRIEPTRPEDWLERFSFETIPRTPWRLERAWTSAS